MNREITRANALFGATALPCLSGGGVASPDGPKVAGASLQSKLRER